MIFPFDITETLRLLRTTGIYLILSQPTKTQARASAAKAELIDPCPLRFPSWLWEIAFGFLSDLWLGCCQARTSTRPGGTNSPLLSYSRFIYPPWYIFSYIVSVNKISASHGSQDGVWRIKYVTRNETKTLTVRRTREPTRDEIRNLMLLRECGLGNTFCDVVSTNKISSCFDRPQDNVWRVKVKTPDGEKTLHVHQVEQPTTQEIRNLLLLRQDSDQHPWWKVDSL